jgi:MFS family permease
VLPGLVVIFAGLAVLTQVGADTSYRLLLTGLFVAGLGMGMTMMPLCAAALRTLTERTVARASTAVSIVQQGAGAIGSAIASIILAALLAGKFGVPASEGLLTASALLADPRTHQAAAIAAADPFATTFVWTLGLAVLCVIPAFFLPRHQPLPAETPEPEKTIS